MPPPLPQRSSQTAGKSTAYARLIHVLLEEEKEAKKASVTQNAECATSMQPVLVLQLV